MSLAYYIHNHTMKDKDEALSFFDTLSGKEKTEVVFMTLTYLDSDDEQPEYFKDLADIIVHGERADHDLVDWILDRMADIVLGYAEDEPDDSWYQGYGTIGVGYVPEVE